MKTLKEMLKSKSNTCFEVTDNSNQLCTVYVTEDGICEYVGTYTKRYVKRVWLETYGYRINIK